MIYNKSVIQSFLLVLLDSSYFCSLYVRYTKSHALHQRLDYSKSCI